MAQRFIQFHDAIQFDRRALEHSISSVSPVGSDPRSPDCSTALVNGRPPIRTRVCSVCGDSPAKVHYGVLACFGCKGFFRRAVKDGRNKYQCRYEKNCVVNKFERNSCRYCRFRKCLQAGMNPDAVRPDRGDAGAESSTGKALPAPKIRLKNSLSKKKSLARTSSIIGADTDDWTKLLGPEHRAVLLDLMRLSKIVSEVECGTFDAVSGFSLKSLIADRSLSSTNYVPASLPSTSTDTSFTAIWRVVSVVDWVDGLVKLFETGKAKVAITVEDKACLVQSSYAQLTLLSLLAHVAAQPSLNDLNAVRSLVETVKLHFPVKDLVRRLSAELVVPLRHSRLSDTDFVILRAIIALNPDCPGLCTSAVTRLREIRAVLFDVLIKSIKRSRQKTIISPSAIFGQLLSLLPSLKHVSGDLINHLSSLYPRLTPSDMPPFARILTDVFSPEQNDLVLESVMEHSNSHSQSNDQGNLIKLESASMPISSNTANFNCSPHPVPSLIVCPPPISIPPQLPSPGPRNLQSPFLQLSPPLSSGLLSPGYGGLRHAPPVNYPVFTCPSTLSVHPSTSTSAFSSSLCSLSPSFGNYNSSSSHSSFMQRPSTLTFSPKLPLQLTKSIEEILRPAGMAEDPNINRPLTSDWAETTGMSTPVFNRDVVAQFFPEMAGQFS